MRVKDGKSEAVDSLRALGYRFIWQQAGLKSKSWFMRRLFNIVEIFRGREYKYIRDDVVPPNGYSMLLAIPPRFQDRFHDEP